MTYTLVAAQGMSIGNTLVEKEQIDLEQKNLDTAGEQLLLPVDSVVAPEFQYDAPHKVVEGDIPDGDLALDIGQQTILELQDALKGAQTVVWNGHMGVFEMSKVAEGTLEVGRALGDLKDDKSNFGGGEDSAAEQTLGIAQQITHISTGGGECLEYLEGQTLPGIAAISEQ